MQISRKGLFVAVIVFFIGLIISRGMGMGAPSSRFHDFHIFAGSVSRTVLRQAYVSTHRANLFPFKPRTLEFNSTNGEVGVYVVDFPVLNDPSQIDLMLQMTQQLQAGQPPENPIAHAKAKNGMIRLHHWSLGRASYLVLLKCEQASDVSLVVNYRR